MQKYKSKNARSAVIFFPFSQNDMMTSAIAFDLPPSPPFSADVIYEWSPEVSKLTSVFYLKNDAWKINILSNNMS